MTYVPLWCKSNYSFLEGASHPEELISQAVFAQLPAVAITDRHGVYGLVRAYQRAKELDFQSKLICGAQLTVQQEESPTSLMLLVQNKAGWKNLCRLLTVGARRSEKGISKTLAGDTGA